MLLIVTGPPCAGKTTLARRLAADMQMPLFTKDDLKERLADVLSESDLDWSRRLGMAANELLYLLAAVEAAAGRSALLESNFDPSFAAAPLAALAAQGAGFLQIVVTASPEILAARYRARAGAMARHAIHHDQLYNESLAPEVLLARHVALPLPGEVITADTDKFGEEAYAQLLIHLQSRVTDTPPIPPLRERQI